MDDRVWELLHRSKRLKGDGRLVEAVAAAQEALSSVTKAEGSNSPSAATVLDALSDLHASEPSEAIAFAERALEIRRQLYGENDVRVAQTLTAIAARLRVVGESEDALRRISGAIAVYRNVQDTSFAYRLALKEQWMILRELGRETDALAAASAFYDLTPPDDDPYAESANHMLAVSLLAIGRASDAIPYFEAVLAKCQETDEQKRRPRSKATAEAAAWLAQARGRKTPAP